MPISPEQTTLTGTGNGFAPTLFGEKTGRYKKRTGYKKGVRNVVA